MGCGASASPTDPVARAKLAEETRLAPLLLRMEEITNLHRRGLMSDSEYEAYRSQINAEIAGRPASNSNGASGVSSQKLARQQRAGEFRQAVDQLARQMKNSPDKLPADYHRLVASLPPKFTCEVPEEDEWRNARSRPLQEYYNTIAGGNIDDLVADGKTQLDPNRNPVGTQYDLPRDGSMQEHTLVLCWFSEEGQYGKPMEALKRKGFNIIVHDARDSTVQQMMVSLLIADVVWIVSGARVAEAGFEQFLDALEAYHRRGGGIFVWGDNTPHVAHANQLLSRLFPGQGIFLEGNDQGSQIMHAHSEGCSPGHFTRHHLIMTGLKALFEGVTISYLSKVGPLKVLATYNNGPGYSGKPYCAVADSEVYARYKVTNSVGRGRIVIDGGFTKLYDEFWVKTAGTERYVKNASTWLLNMNSRIASEGEDIPTVGHGQTPTARPRPYAKTYRANSYAPSY
mmetsp:Transcript_86515/g.217871  ORF Transcript_86515/g.217871 Transcript_86515/m.217871 type:complete len:456 (+) Transcript_86515:110-1477(+)